MIIKNRAKSKDYIIPRLPPIKKRPLYLFAGLLLAGLFGSAGAHAQMSFNGDTTGTVFANSLEPVIGALKYNNADPDGSTELARQPITRTRYGGFRVYERIWVYHAVFNDPDGIALADGETATETFTVAAAADPTATQTITITIRGVNDAPMPDARATVTSVVGGRPLTLDGSRSYDPDTNDAIETWTWSGDPDVDYGTADTSQPTFTFIAPNDGFIEGQRRMRFYLVVNDGDTNSASPLIPGVNAPPDQIRNPFGARLVTVYANRDPYSIGRIAPQTVALNRPVTLDVSRKFSDSNRDPLTYSVGDTHDTGIVTAGVDVAGMVTLTAVATGMTTVTIIATDPSEAAASHTVDVTVIEDPGTAPAIQEDTPDDVVFSGNTGTVDAAVPEITGTLAVADETVEYTPQADAPTTYGTFNLNAAGEWNWILDPNNPDFIALPAENYATDIITFTASVGEGSSLPATITIAVMGRNDAPEVETPIAAQRTTVGGANVVLNLADFFRDPDTGDTLTFTAQSSDTNVATATASNPLTVTPVAQGRATITVTATDGRGAATIQEFPIEVSAQGAGPDIDDADNGGVDDDENAFPDDPGEQNNADGDGNGDNAADTDDDNDGVSDAEGAFPNDPGEQNNADGDGNGDNAADTDDGNDGVSDAEGVFPNDPGEQNNADSDGNGDNADEGFGVLVRQYLQTTSAGANEAVALHIINAAEAPQRFLGNLYGRSGEQLGESDQPLGLTVAPNGRLILDSGDLEAIFDVPPWRGPAMLEVVGSADSAGGYSLMSRLTSPSGLVSNTNCVREGNVLNVEGFDSPDRTYVRFINVMDEPLGEVRGTLYDRQGEVIGNRNALLLASVAPKAQVWLDRDDLAALVGAPTWTGEAMLVVAGRFPQVAEGSSLKLLNLNLVADVGGGTFFNFSCFEDSGRDARGGRYGRVYLQTTSTSPNVSLTQVVNTSALRQRFTGSLYARSGERLGPAAQPLHEGTIRGRGRLILSSADLERIFGVSPWEGPAMLTVKGSEDFALMTKLTSPSGLVSNTNCVRRGQVHNILGTDSADRSFVRFINIGEDSLANVRGTLYDSAGEVIGSSDIPLLETLAPKAQIWLDRDDLAALAGDTWQGTASLVITPAPEDALASLRLLNLNLVNSETYFNFSCYEESLQPR